MRNIIKREKHASLRRGGLGRDFVHGVDRFAAGRDGVWRRRFSRRNHQVLRKPAGKPESTTND
jgi:hypothetical protein